MKITFECESKEMADFILVLSQPIVNVDNVISSITDKMKDTMDLVSHTLQE